MSQVTDRITLDAIGQDVQFAGRLVSSIQGRAAQDTGPIALFCTAPYLSLFIHESERHLQRLQPGLAKTLSGGASAAVARSRHSLKLFEDTKRTVEEQLEYFRDTLTPAHQARFLGRTWLRPARFLETDLGMYLYRGVPIATTHGISLTLGAEPSQLLGDNAGSILYDLAVEYGEYFGACGARIEPTAVSFASKMKPDLLKNRDVKSWKEYRRSFNGPTTPELNGLLSAFQASINFVSEVLVLDDYPASRQTLFKIQFLTLYGVLRSLDVLRRRGAASGLTNHSLVVVKKLSITRCLLKSWSPARSRSVTH